MEGTEKSDGYQPLNENKAAPSTKVNIKKDPSYLRLQVVEQEISEYNIVKFYISAILVNLFPSLFSDILTNYSCLRL